MSSRNQNQLAGPQQHEVSMLSAYGLHVVAKPDQCVLAEACSWHHSPLKIGFQSMIGSKLECVFRRKMSRFGERLRLTNKSDANSLSNRRAILPTREKY